MNGNDNQGGYIIPHEFSIDEPYDNWIAKWIRGIGWATVRFGSWIRSFGYYQRKVYPYKELMEVVEEMKAKRK